MPTRRTRRHQRRVAVLSLLLVFDMGVLGAGIAAALSFHRTKGSPAHSSPSSNPPASTGGLSPTIDASSTVPSASGSTGGGGGASPTLPGGSSAGVTPGGSDGPAAAGSAGAAVAAAPPVTATCASDVPLSAAPDAPFSFLCTANGQPVTWPRRSLTLSSSGLDPLQSVALPVALTQFQSVSGLQVTVVPPGSAADVSVSATPLSNDEDGYTTTAYECTDHCAFTHADVQLSSTATLGSTLWISTILHELGHVAGLNHVARRSAVMYPNINATSPVVYSADDRAGFDALAAARPA